MTLSLLSVPIAISMAISTAGAAATLQGVARAKDGDSLMVGQTEVRLFGVDAPEFDQTCERGATHWACGAEAAERLSRLVSGKEVRCTCLGKDQHNRTLGRCSLGTTDINRIMVATGYAVAYRRYSSEYVSAEETAKANKRGIWSGTFVMPSDFRHDEALPVRSKPQRQPRDRRPEAVRGVMPASSRVCAIKGNQGTHGWIYHVPGMPYYTQNRAEQVFCSEVDARAAGYRRAKVR